MAQTLIFSTKLSSDTTAVDIMSIPQSYKSLILEVIGAAASGGTDNILAFTVNSNTSAIYSGVGMFGDGSTQSNLRFTSGQYADKCALIWRFPPAGRSYGRVTIFNYTGATYKTALLRLGAPSWASVAESIRIATGAAITAIRVKGFNGGCNLAAGMTIRLWGVG